MKALLLLFPILALAQHPLDGKSFRTKTSESCTKTTNGGYMEYSHLTMAFTADSVTVTGYTKRSDSDEPQLTAMHYTYRMNINGDSFSLDGPANDRYIIREGVLVSDCTYNRGREYFEISSD